MALVAAVLSGAATDFEMNCPATARIEQKAVDSGDGWESVSGLEVRTLVNVEFSDGHPKDRAILRPGSEARRVATYEFETVQSPWLACTYKNTGAKIAKRLPEGVKSCSVAYPSLKIRCQKP
jgi:hypothetical protein